MGNPGKLGRTGKRRSQSNGLAIRRANSMGVEKVALEKRSKTMVNTRTCPKCGAKPGTTCFVLTAKVFHELKVTHTKFSVRQGEYKEPMVPPTAEELATRKRSTPVLDARYAVKKAREEMNARKLNGHGG